jgi:DNA-binding GntR family transcriptional regulator
MWDNTERYRIRYLHHDYADPTSESNEQLRAAQVEHRLISEAALAGDAIACGAASVEHLHQSLEIVYREAATPPRVRIADQALRLSSAAGATP